MSQGLIQAPPVAGSRWRTAVIAVTAGVAALFLGKLLLTLVMSPGALGGATALALLIDVGWRGLAWAALTAAFVALAPPRVARGLSIAAAPFAALGTSVIEYLPALTFDDAGFLFLLLAIPFALDAVAMLVCAVIGWAISGRVRSPGPRRDRALVPGSALALIVGGVATIALFSQWFEVHFRLFNVNVVEPEPFGATGIRYLVTAGIAVAATLAAAVLATVAKQRGLKITSWILVPVVIAIALVLQVPQGRFDPPPAPEPDLSFYTECSFDANRPGCGG
ncbi:hypothetical protein [Salinibacterium sp. ZJ70]|uniref:hypothetical protein n=1 Tax=Salinibacterium sp. ZJ70 TaxID=2708084 RepID=UPI0014209C28|nr:hypothetical protein [Salinibacterium sp. ZJ70]